MNLIKRTKDNGGVIGIRAVHEETGVPMGELTEWAEKNDIDEIDGVYVFRPADVELLLEELEEDDDDAEEDDEPDDLEDDDE